MKNNPYFCT